MAYPIPAFHFEVTLGGSAIGFSEASGLTVENDVIEYRDGFSPEFTKIKLAGLKKYSNITLKRGIVEDSGNNEFFKWIKTTSMRKTERKDLTISLLNEDHAPVMSWSIKNAWPIKVEGPSLKSDDNNVAIESIELAHEGLTLV
ncbi:phage tail protein [Ekhidna sp.]